MVKQPRLHRPPVVLLLISIVIVSPFSFYYFYLNSKSVYLSQEYVKEKIKVDSLHVSTTTFSDGGSTTYYNFYNIQRNIKVSVIDNENSIWRYFGSDNLALEAAYYMKNHNDSIWIWYHPKVKPKYAKEEETVFSVGKHLLCLLLNGVVILLTCYAINWQIQYQRHKKNNQNSNP